MALPVNLNLSSSSAEHPPFALIGLGPYVKKHYFNLFAELKTAPKFIIDLDSRQADLTDFLQKKKSDIPLLLVPEKDRDKEVLPLETKRMIQSWLMKYGVRHAILATEPKAHLAYLDFFAEIGIQVLVEKPLTSPLFASFSSESAMKVEQDFNQLLAKSKKTRIDLQCQRRYHPIYQFVLKQMEDFLSEFDIPMTYCDIYHSDGMWNMPDEFISRENHPYKYGYGKLMHSGYHFIDLLAWLIQTNQKFCSKTVDRGELYATNFSPTDSLSTFTESDYNRFFPEANYNHIFKKANELGFDHFGELDFFSLLQLYQGDRKITTCSVNLLQNGFSQRAWNHLPEDTYKGNGRVRHERLNIQFGPLMNIQVHSYLGDEEKELSFSSSVGRKNHFDVLIFRNSRLIGGSPFTHLRSDDFMSKGESKNFNEISRAKCFANFIQGENSLSSLSDHALSIQLLTHSLKAICNKKQKDKEAQIFSLNV